MPSSTVSIADLNRRAERRLAALLARARTLRELRKRGPAMKPWQAGVRVVGTTWMRRLNRDFRKKDYATDVLSFPAPEIFADTHGWIGELVICAPVLLRQAKGEGHSAAAELDILLAHGLLHLLGFDHERGPADAKEMARFEARLLGRTRPGLVARAG